MTIVEHLSKFSELITGSDGEQNFLTKKWFKDLVNIMRRNLENKIIPSPGIVSRCPPNIAGHFLMAERAMHLSDDISREVKKCIRKDYMAHVRDIQWTTDADNQVEKNLWTLFVGQEVIDGFSLNDYETELCACFNTLVSRRSHVLCLISWLFPKIATPERMNIVEGIVADESLATWCLRDRMLFWLACVKDANCSQEKAMNIEAQIRRCFGEFGTVEGLDENGDFIPSAIGLLILISCAKQNSDNCVDDMVWQTVRRIVEHLIEARLDDDKVCRYYESDIGWAYYALCEYVDYVNLF